MLLLIHICYYKMSWLRVLFHDFFCFAILLNLLFFLRYFMYFFFHSVLIKIVVVFIFWWCAQFRSITDGQICTIHFSACSQWSTHKKKEKIMWLQNETNSIQLRYIYQSRAISIYFTDRFIYIFFLLILKKLN